ncbi:NusG domain II-containing protein [Lachnospira multipara]|uniref:NusG domain II-containing protein n=1 Tax=Lachnospira multipara TaxID=28051 RepID=UPI00041C9110|nr:NusG domain II-containing protein [Lachnospira multipara]
MDLNKKDMKEMKEMKKADSSKDKSKASSKKIAIILSLLILVIGLGAGLSLYIMNKEATDGSYAYIYQNNELIKVVDLTNVKEDYEFRIDSEDGGYNIVKVTTDGSIGIIEASCPDHVCMNTGFIRNGLVPITCLPNELVIEVKNSKEDSNLEYDGVAQ